MTAQMQTETTPAAAQRSMTIFMALAETTREQGEWVPVTCLAVYLGEAGQLGATTSIRPPGYDLCKQLFGR